MSTASPPVVAPCASPLYMKAGRWRRHLVETSRAFGELQAERELGWKSPALDQWYASRRPQAEKAAPASDSNGPNNTKHSETAPVTSFANADIGALADRYRAHYSRITADAAPDIFGKLSTPRRYLDIGCAPGGVSKFLSLDLRWDGTGVTLPIEMGGIAMDQDVLSAGGERYQILYGDITQPASTWQSPCRESTSAIVDVAGSTYDFVNCGAVQDHAQRQVAAAGSGHGPESSEADDPSGALLPWFTLFVPQLRIALEHVAAGGSVMIVYGAPHCASLMIILKALEPLMDGSETPAVTVMETMHLMKPPVYVLIRRLSVNTPEKKKYAARLLEAFDPASPIINPVVPSDGGAVATEALRTSKQQFWLGESDDGFSLACEGFHSYGASLERVWDKTKGFLAARRIRAEQQMQRTKRSRVN